jgi:hypothetical protein
VAARIFLTSAGVRSIPFGWLQGFAMTFNCLLHVLGEVIIDEMRPSGFAFAGWDLGKYWRRSLKAVAFSTTKMFCLTVGDPNGESLAFSVSSESETCVRSSLFPLTISDKRLPLTAIFAARGSREEALWRSVKNRGRL